MREGQSEDDFKIDNKEEVKAKIFLYDEKNITAKTFKDYCRNQNIVPEKTVFVFPGNSTHHDQNSTLYSVKSGSGLGVPAKELGGQGIPVLSLPTSGIDNLKETDPIPSIPENAMANLFKAAGFGLNIVVPIREKKNNTYFSEEYYFTLENGKKFEPSFWGETNLEPNPKLANYYFALIDVLIKIDQLPDDKRKTSLEHEINSTNTDDMYKKCFRAYLEGYEQRNLSDNDKDKDPWYTTTSAPAPTPLRAPIPSSNISTNARLTSDHPKSSFNRSTKMEVINFLEYEGYQIDDSGKELVKVRKDNVNIFTITPSEIMVTAKNVNEDIYDDLLHSAILLFPSNEKLLIYVPQSQKALYEAALNSNTINQKNRARFHFTSNIEDYKAGKIPEPEQQSQLKIVPHNEAFDDDNENINTVKPAEKAVLKNEEIKSNIDLDDEEDDEEDFFSDPQPIIKKVKVNTKAKDKDESKSDVTNSDDAKLEDDKKLNLYSTNKK